MYLMKYGYMDGQRKDTKSAPLLSRDGLRDYIREFQSFAGLPQTGNLDAKTVELMKTPRCGVKDIVGKGATARKKRYALQGKMVFPFLMIYNPILSEISSVGYHTFIIPGSRWKVRSLTYKISKYPTTQRLSNSEVDKEIQKALQVWSDVTDLSFEQRSNGRGWLHLPS